MLIILAVLLFGVSLHSIPWAMAYAGAMSALWLPVLASMGVMAAYWQQSDNGSLLAALWHLAGLVGVLSALALYSPAILETAAGLPRPVATAQTAILYLALPALASGAPLIRFAWEWRVNTLGSRKS